MDRPEDRAGGLAPPEGPLSGGAEPQNPSLEKPKHLPFHLLLHRSSKQDIPDLRESRPKHEAAGPEPEPEPEPQTCSSAGTHPPDFEGFDFDQQVSGALGGPTGSQDPPDLNSIFQLLEETIVGFVRKELRRIQKVLSTDGPEEEDGERGGGGRDPFLKLTLHFLRKMKQEELAEHLESKTVGTDFQQELKSSLQRKLQRVFEGLSEAGKPPDLLNQLHLAGGGAAGGGDQQHEVTQMEVASRKVAIQETAIRQEDIFKGPPGREQPIRVVLTKGVAGIGKTVLTQKFTLDWAEGRANQDIHFLFPFSFRELNVLRHKEFSLVELVHHFFPETRAAGVCSSAEFQVVFILDGLDESRLPLEWENKSITEVTESSSISVLLTSLIRGNLLPSARLWITTRPAAANQIPADCVGMVTEVRGFKDEQKEEYFRRRFREKSQASSIISHIRSVRSLHIMCHIPVFCWISATVLEKMLSTRGGGQLPGTLTEMYVHFLVVQAKIKRVKFDGGAETDPIWNKETRKMVESLGKLAFEQLLKGNLIFYESDLAECGINVDDASKYSGVFNQVFREERGLHQDRVFCFVHLSVQEFLAALHLHLTFHRSGINLLGNSESQRSDPQRSDPQRSDPQRSESQRSDPQRSDPQRSDPQRSESQRSDPQRSDPRRSEPQRSDPQRSESQRSDPQRSESQRSDSQRSDPQRSESQRSDPQRSDPQRSEPQRSESQRSESRRSDPQRSDPQRCESQRSESKRPDPQRSESQRSEPQRSDPQRSDPQRSESQRSDPQRSDPQRSDSQRSDPRNPKSQRSDPQRSESQRSESQRSESQRSDPQRSDPQRSDPRNPKSQKSDPQRSESRRSESLRSESRKRSDPQRSESQRSDPRKLKSQRSDPPTESQISDPPSEVLSPDPPAEVRFYQAVLDQALRSPNGHLDLVLRFLLGLSLPANQRLLRGLLPSVGGGGCRGNQRLVQVVRDRLGGGGILSAERSFNLLHCLGELGDGGLLGGVQEALGGGRLVAQDLSPPQWAALVLLLLSSPQEHLDLFELDRFWASEEALMRLLPVVRASKRAVLSCCGLGGGACAALAELLGSEGCGLKELDLSNNDLQDGGAQRLSEGLRSPHCRLEALSLSGCLLSEVGCAAVASALSSNPTHLRDLDLSYNHPGASGGQLLRALEDPQIRLQTLRLEHCGEDKLQPGFRKYFCRLELDLASVNQNLQVSRDLRTVQLVQTRQNQTRDQDHQTRDQQTRDRQNQTRQNQTRDQDHQTRDQQNQTRDQQNQTRQNQTKQNQTRDQQNQTRQNQTKENQTKQNQNRDQDHQTRDQQTRDQQNQTRQNQTRQNQTRQNQTKQNQTRDQTQDQDQQDQDQQSRDQQNQTRDQQRDQPTRAPERFQTLDPPPRAPERFQEWQLLCGPPLTGRCFWEVEWRGGVRVAVSYRGVGRFGENPRSWRLSCSRGGFSVCHRNQRTFISASRVSRRVAVYLDAPAGTLSFYRRGAGGLLHLHTFRARFTEPLYAGFGFTCYDSAVTLCPPEEATGAAS